MTWRRFMVLVRGLSPNSATVTSIQMGKVASKQDVRTMETPEQATAAFQALFGSRKAKVARRH